MKVKVRPMRKAGRNMPHQEQTDTPQVVGLLSIGETRDHELGRTVVRAQLMDAIKVPGTELLPDLTDARILWIDGSRMRVTGMERLVNASYAQTWAVEVL